MPTFIIERKFAERLDLTGDDVRLLEGINAEEGVRWVFSFLSADHLCTYCLYEGTVAVAIMAAAQRANIPADAIVEVETQTLGVPGRPHEWAAAQAAPQQ